MTETLTELTDEDEMALAMAAFGVVASPRDPDEMIDGVEARMLELYKPIDCRTSHVFTPGMYARSVFMPAGAMITSKIHKTQHQYVIMKGSVSVWTAEEGAVTLHAPFHGVTNPGTRRILLIHDDTVWTTFHPTTETDLAKIEEDIIMPRINPQLEKALS